MGECPLEVTGYVRNRSAVPPLSRNLRVSPDVSLGGPRAEDPGFPVGEPERAPESPPRLLSSVAYVCGSWA